MRSHALLGAVLALSCGCASSNPPEPDAHDFSHQESWAGCHQAYQPTGQLDADLSWLTRRCAEQLGMTQLTPIVKGAQSAEQPAERYSFFISEAGLCTRVVAVGDAQVRDLDLLLRDPDGAPLVADLTHDNYPLLPPTGPLCFDQPGTYTLEVSVFEGSGRYALQVWAGLP